MNSKHQSCWFNLRFLPSLSITCGMELLLLNHKTTVHRERKLEEHLFKVPGHSIHSIFFTKKYTMTKIKSLLQIMTTQLDCRIFIYKNKLYFVIPAFFIRIAKYWITSADICSMFLLLWNVKKTKKKLRVVPFSNSHGRFY